MKNKKIIASIILGATILSAASLAGCGGETTTPETTAAATTAAPAATTAASVVETAAATEAKVLEDIAITDNVSGDAWEYRDDNCQIAVSAGYCKTTDVVYNVTFSMKVAKDSANYESFKTELQNFESQIKALNDSNLFASFKESDEGIEFAADFDGLELADRATRIAIAEEVTDLTANSSDTAFHYTEIDSQLQGYGFQ